MWKTTTMPAWAAHRAAAKRRALREALLDARAVARVAAGLSWRPSDVAAFYARPTRDQRGSTGPAAANDAAPRPGLPSRAGGEV